MTDQTEPKCGAETSSGDECKNPAEANGRCWIPSHNPEGSDENPQGRPSLLEEYRDEILEGARKGMTLQGCARVAGVGESTLYDWLNEYPGFSESLKRARAKGEAKRLENADDPGSRFVLERSFGYTKTEERKHEHTGEGGGPIEIQFNEEVVETPYSERENDDDLVGTDEVTE